MWFIGKEMLLAGENAGLAAAKCRTLKLESLAKFVEESVKERLFYMDFPTEHWRKLCRGCCSSAQQKPVNAMHNINTSFSIFFHS
ncbi:MAG: hypothetical protein J6T08_01305, partial [Lentisphaeria bacterium]|nr:hypothetical protein [Lentisphaeria bacterium]